jgi:hypothetical protein
MWVWVAIQVLSAAILAVAIIFAMNWPPLLEVALALVLFSALTLGVWLINRRIALRRR